MRCSVIQQSYQICQATGWQGCVLVHHQVDQCGSTSSLILRTVVQRGMAGQGIDTRATVTPLDPEQTAVMHIVQQLRTGSARTAPVVLHPSLGNMLLQLSRMHFSPLTHKRQYIGSLAQDICIPDAFWLAWLQQGHGFAWQKTIVDQIVFIDWQPFITPLQIACTITLHTMPQSQILRSRRRTYRVCLYKAQTTDGGQQRCRREQAARYCITAQIFKLGCSGHGSMGTQKSPP